MPELARGVVNHRIRHTRVCLRFDDHRLRCYSNLEPAGIQPILRLGQLSLLSTAGVWVGFNVAV